MLRKHKITLSIIWILYSCAHKTNTLENTNTEHDTDT